MPKVIDYYLSLNSPFVYLGSRRLEEIAARHRAAVNVKPVNYGEIFPQTGGLPLPKRAPARQAYRLVELARWRDHLDLPLTLQPATFPAPELTAACLVIAAAETNGDPLRLAHAIGRAVWAEERNIADQGTLMEIAEATGHHALNLMSKALDPETRSRYAALTQEALAKGVFGAPSYIYEDELFWGQDRLDFLERALAA